MDGRVPDFEDESVERVCEAYAGNTDRLVALERLGLLDLPRRLEPASGDDEP